MSEALVYRFTADTANFKAGVDGLKAQLNSLSANAKDQSQKVSGGFDSIKGTVEKLTLGIAALAAAAAAYLVGVGDQAVKVGDAIRQAAGAFDQTVTTMGEVKAVADRSGASLDSLGKSFVDLQRKARTGDEAVTFALKAIGMSARDVAGLTQRELAEKLADTFSSLRDSSNKTAAAVALFGADVAGKLTPQLNRGRAALDDVMAAAHRAGAVMSPELSDKIAGTSAIFQRFKDHVAEGAATVQGKLLQAFVQFKPAIDSLMQTFTDLTGNIVRAIEWWNGLGDATRNTGQSFSYLSAAAEYLASKIRDLVAFVEAWVVRTAKAVDAVIMYFKGLAEVVAAFGQDVSQMAIIAAESLYNAFREAVRGVMTLFSDLAAAGSKALSFDLSGVKASLGALGNDAANVGAKVKSALNVEYLGRTKAAGDAARKALTDSFKPYDDALEKIEKQRRAQKDLLKEGGAKAPPQGKLDAGDPAVPKKAGASPKDLADTKDAVERYLDSLNKANKTAQAEYDTWAKTNVERAKAVALGQAQAAAEKDGIALTEQQKQKVAALATATQALKDKTEGLRNAAQGLSDTFAEALDTLIVKGGKFNDVMRNVLQTLASAALKASLAGDGMFGMFGGAAGGGGLFGSLFKGLFGGFKADGGPVMGGRAYVVGERGPELFQPNGGGAILPNGAGGGSGASSPSSIVVHVAGANGDAQIRQMVTAGVQAGLKQFSTSVLPGRLNEIQMRGV